MTALYLETDGEGLGEWSDGVLLEGVEELLDQSLRGNANI